MMVRSQPGQFDYKYIVTSGSTAHTAFRTKRGYKHFLNQTGIREGKVGWLGQINLVGSYREISLGNKQRDLDRYAKRRGWIPTKVLQNGDYIRGYISRTKKGSNIYSLNPNYKPRKLKYYYP